MSRDAIVLAKEPCSLSDIWKALQAVGVNFSKTFEPGSSAELTGEVASLSVLADKDHGLVDDGPIRFSEFLCAISFSRAGMGPEMDLFEDLCVSIAKIVASILSRNVPCQTLVVRNGVHIEASYPAQCAHES